MCNSAAHNNRPGRESVSRRIGKVVTAGIKARDGHKCAYCGAEEAASAVHFHLDHLTPRSKGGEDTPTNLVLACARCNSARKDMSLRAWAEKAARDLGIVVDPRKVRGQARRRLPKAA